MDTKKDAARKKSLGELGELFAIKALVDAKFDKIRNLNYTKMNEKFADIYCEKGNERYVISVKARNKYTKTGKINTFYNLSSNNDVYEKAENISKKYNAKPYWMAIQFTSNDYSIYFGSLESLNGKSSIPVKECEAGRLGEILVYQKKHFFDFDYYTNQSQDDEI